MTGKDSKLLIMVWGFPGDSVGKNLPANAGHTGDRLDAWVRKIPWRRKWQPTPASLPGKSYGQRSLQATIHKGRQESGPKTKHACSHGLVFLETRSRKAPTQSGLHRTKAAPGALITQECTRVLRALFLESEPRNNTFIFYYLTTSNLSAYILIRA